MFLKNLLCRNLSNIRNCFRVFLHSFKKQFVSWYFNFNSCNRLHSDRYIFSLFKCYASPPTTKVMGIRSVGVL